MSRALDPNPGSASDALRTESFWKSVSYIREFLLSPYPSYLSFNSCQELKDKYEVYGERRNTSVPRPLEIGLMLPADRFESEFLLKRLCWNCFENTVTKADQLDEMGAKSFSTTTEFTDVFVISHF